MLIPFQDPVEIGMTLEQLVAAISSKRQLSQGVVNSFNSPYTHLILGKSVGMPVLSTCNFAGWENLATAGYWGVVPKTKLVNG